LFSGPNKRTAGLTAPYIIVLRLVSLQSLLQTRMVTPASLQCFVFLALLAVYKLFIPLVFILFNDSLSTSNIRSNFSFGNVSDMRW
jgi:hypothetical protein